MKTILSNEPAQIVIAFIGAVFFIGFNTIANYPYGLTDSSWVIIVGSIWFTVWLSHAHAQAQSRYIGSGKHPKHGLLFLIRATVAALLAYVIHKDLPGFTLSWSYLTELYHTATFRLTVTMGACFWLSFDLFLNHYRDKPLFYVSEYYRTALLDRLMRYIFSGSKPHFILMFSVKVALLVYTIFFFYIKSYNTWTRI